MGSLEGTASASLASLRTALARLRREYYLHPGAAWARDDWKKDRLWIGLVRSEKDLHRLQVEDDRGFTSFESLRVPPTSPAILFEDDQLRVRVVMRKEEAPDVGAVNRLLGPFLARRSTSCEIAVEPVPEEDGRGFDLILDLHQVPRRGATLGDLWMLGDDARALLEAAEGDELPRSAALDLLCAGRWDLFKGQPESDWLEAKGEPYDHLEPKIGDSWRFELAKDVASFANAPEGGMIVLGMVTKDRGDGDVIQGHKEFDLKRVKASTYRRYIAQLVYPRIKGFEVRRIRGKNQGSGLVVLVVPPQPDTSRPFLVQGVISGRKALGAHILLPERREDDTALLGAEAIHARLRLGEQVINGEKSGS